MKGNPPACQQSCELSQGDTALPIPRKPRPSPELHQHTHHCNPQCHAWLPGLCWLSQRPGHGRQAAGGILAARRTLMERTMGAAQGSLLTDCSDLVPSFLDFPPRGGPHLIQSLDLSQMHMTGWLSQMGKKPVLRASEDLKWTWQPGRPAALTATKHWRTRRSLPPTSVYTAGRRGSPPHIPANRATLGGKGALSQNELYQRGQNSA